MNHTTSVSDKSATPLYARIAATAGRPAVLIGALLMSAPAEISLAQTAGFHGGTEYLAPLVLSLYAACAAVIAATRPKGVRGRLSAICGAAIALGFGMGAQIVSHLLAAGYVSSGPWLIAAISSVPAISAAHLLHLAVTPREKAVEEEKGPRSVRTPGEPENDTEETEAPTPAAPSVSDKSVTRKKGAAPKATLVAIRDAAQNLDATGRKVNAEALADWFNVSKRTGHRYMSQLMAA